MKINLNSLKYLYKYIKNNDLSYKIDIKNEDFKENDLKDYIIATIIDNIEYDFGVNFSDYVDLNNFIEYDTE